MRAQTIAADETSLSTLATITFSERLSLSFFLYRGSAEVFGSQ